MIRIEFPYDKNGEWEYYEVIMGPSFYKEVGTDKMFYQVVNKMTGVPEYEEAVLGPCLYTAENLNTHLKKLLEEFNVKTLKPRLVKSDEYKH